MWCERILVAYDGSSPSCKALELARSICVQDKTLELILVHVVKLYSSGAAAVGMDTVFIDATNTMREELDRAAAEIPNRTQIRLLKGSSPADLILNCARDERCDLIVMGSRGRGGVKGYLGSVSYAVVQRSPIAVLIAKDPTDQSRREVHN